MKRFQVADLARIIKAESIETTATFTGVSTDSRTIGPGQCFFAIKGENFDGVVFLAGAFAKGAVCAVVNKDVNTEEFADKTILKVNDSLQALGDFARWYRQKGEFKVIAITGSVGKTTTRNIISHVLSRRYQVHQAPKNFNTLTGLPLSILAADSDDQILVLELGTNHPGEIAALTRIAIPDIALITNIHPSHLEGFGSLENIAEEKAAISEGLKEEGLLIINADCRALVNACRQKDLDFVTFGKSAVTDFYAENIQYKDLSSTFAINGTGIYLPLPGSGAVENTIAAWSVCSRLGIRVEDFAEAVKAVRPVSMRAELLRIGTLTVLDDCYNANPASMENALDILSNLSRNKKRRSVFICGDMAELGEDAEKLHQELGCCVAKANVRLLLAVGQLAGLTAEAAGKNADYDLEIKFFDDALSACNKLADYIKDYDIILVKGSRAMKLETVVEKLKDLFGPA
ncbi:UDP-N-acetylmuramoyl-tripeptide--D-alanyl-D-alanine ligase [Planctomycetota bacterium]